jgi:hypothetical protein
MLHILSNRWILSCLALAALGGTDLGAGGALAMATRPSSTPGVGPIASPTATPDVPVPMVSMRPAGLQEAPVFGKILALRTVESERTAIAIDGDDAKTKAMGNSTSRYLRLDNGVEYAIHWQDAGRFAKLAVGDSVNVYPTQDSACFERSNGADCRVLMRVFPGKSFVPPLKML